MRQARARRRQRLTGQRLLHFARWQIVCIVLVVVFGIFAVMPNLVPRSWTENLPSWLPKERIWLGLDLQGGAYLLYYVDRQDYIDKRLRTIESEVRQALRTETRIGYTGLGKVDGVVQVVRPDKDRRRMVIRAAEALHNLSCNMRGVVVNHLSGTDAGGYGYGYGYGFGYSVIEPSSESTLACPTPAAEPASIPFPAAATASASAGEMNEQANYFEQQKAA